MIDNTENKSIKQTNTWDRLIVHFRETSSEIMHVDVQIVWISHRLLQHEYKRVVQPLTEQWNLHQIGNFHIFGHIQYLLFQLRSKIDLRVCIIRVIISRVIHCVIRVIR